MREREPCGSRTLFRPRRKVFRPCGSIEIREHLRLAACAPSSTVPWSLFSTARPERPDLTVRASSFDHAKEFLGSMTQPNRKRLNLATPAPSFSTSPQSFWAQRFNRTLSAREPCGSRASSPALRSLLSTTRPNCRTLGPCGLYVLIRLRHEVFEPCGSIEH